MSFVGFFGSRSLPSVPAPGGLVSRVVGSVVGAGHSVAVGCCVGADAAALSARLRLPFPPSSSGPALSVFAVGGPSASADASFVSRLASLSGFWRGSALGHVRAAAALSVSPGHGVVAPASVRWWAGGGAAVPLRSRLRQRSAAMVSFVASSGGIGLVGFVRGGPAVSPGSWRTVRLGLAAGLPVAVFPVGFSPLVVRGVSPPVAFVAVVSPGSGVWRHSVLFLPRPA